MGQQNWTPSLAGRRVLRGEGLLGRDQWEGGHPADPGSPGTSRGVCKTAPEPHSAPPGGSRGPGTAPVSRSRSCPRRATGPGRRDRGAAPPRHLPRRCRDPCAPLSPLPALRRLPNHRRGPPGRPRLPTRGRPPLTFNRHDVLAMDRTNWTAGAAGWREGAGRAEAADRRGGAGPAIAGVRGAEGSRGRGARGGAEEGPRAPRARAAEAMEPSGAAAAAAAGT